MTRKIVGGTKDENGIYIKTPSVLPSVEVPPTPPIQDVKASVHDMDIDSLLQRGLRAIYGLMRAIESDIGTGMPSRETVMNLKDANTMLWEFKKKEQEFLDSLSLEQLQALADK